MAGVVRVLVVDDSAFIRKVLTQMLRRSPFIDVVGTARDGEEALQLVEQLRPDVVTLDLIMPGVDGVEFLRRQMAKDPIPVVICSIAHESGEAALEAFDAGAVELVQKPTALATDRIYEIADELVAKVKTAATVKMARAPIPSIAAEAARAEPISLAATRRQPQVEIVVLGISTGGPQALRQLIPRLPASFPVPIAIVLHMPVGYTEMYAQRLNDISALEVVEAREGDLVRPGAVFVAPAGRHLTFTRAGDATIRAHLDMRPFDTAHRPSVDVLFQSAADIFGDRVLGVVMTGMGNDGLVGSAHIKAKGGRIVVEAESSCVVYGMPRVVSEALLSDRVAALDDMAQTIVEMV
jgi:two-component system chemotaxis response regulator CheB